MEIKNISDIQKYTVAIFREKNFECKQHGSGILVTIKGSHYLISAYHVLDLEEEQIQIEIDSDEKDIPHDDLDMFYAKGKNDFFHINEYTLGDVFTAHYDEETGKPVFDDDTEWCFCILSEEMVCRFFEIGKLFYEIDDNAYLEADANITAIVSGYPKYAQKENHEEYRSYRSKTIKFDSSYNSKLIRVSFDNDNAYNIEKKRIVKLPPKGIEGMSGGGIWGEKDGEYFPIGIVIKQDPNEKYIEGYRFNEIVKRINTYLSNKSELMP